MPRLLDPDDCYCGICDGGTRAPPGYMGGTHCPCKCHSLTGQLLEDFVAERKKRRDTAMEKLVDDLMRKGNPLGEDGETKV